MVWTYLKASPTVILDAPPPNRTHETDNSSSHLASCGVGTQHTKKAHSQLRLYLHECNGEQVFDKVAF